LARFPIGKPPSLDGSKGSSIVGGMLKVGDAGVVSTS
jgi:hypothetical protein